MKFKKGDTFYLQKGRPWDPLYKCHVLTVVDEDRVVYKWYGRSKKWWHYEVEQAGYLQALIDIWSKKKKQQKEK